MGQDKERTRRSPRRPWFSTGRPSPKQIADADDLISGLHKAKAVSDFERDDLKGAVNTHKVTDPFVDVDELSKYGSKRIKNLINVVESAPGYGKVPADSMGSIEHALHLAQEAEAQLNGPIITRRSLLSGLGGVVAVAGILYLAANVSVPEPAVPQRVNKPPTAPPPAPARTPVPTTAPSPRPTLFPATPTLDRPSPSPIPPKVSPTVKVIPPGEPIARKAELILEQDYLGPEAVKKAFGIQIAPNKVPPIPFNQREIEWAKSLGEMLVLRTNTYSEGRPLTGLVMESILGDLFFKNNKSQVFAGGFDSRVDEGKLFFDQAPRPGWAIVSKEPLSNSYGRNILDQTQVLVDALSAREFVDRIVPDKYKEAIQEFDSKIRELDKIYRQFSLNAVVPTLNLKINQLARPTFSEVCYDLLLYFQNNGQRLLADTATNTITYTHDGNKEKTNAHNVVVGGFTEEGITNGYRTSSWKIGVTISRR